MVHHTQQRQPFSNRKSLPAIIFARNGKVRTFRVRLWVAGPLFCLLGLILVAYIGATSYLVFRDDLLGAAVARQVSMQHSYEDRISALRSELDRVTSRHVVATAGVEEQLGMLLDRQATIEERQSTLDGLMQKARETGIEVAADISRTPRARPEEQAAAPTPPLQTLAPLAYAPTERSAADAIITGALGAASPRNEVDRELRLRPMLNDVQSSLDEMQEQQSDALDVLGAATEDEAGKLSSAVAPLGLELEDFQEDEPQGGPFVPASAGMHFVERTAVLSRTLAEIAALRHAAEEMPVRAPVVATRISSRFGYRTDPFLGKAALHAGIDFVASAGSAVHATGPGKVVSAGWEGGYGRMIEIRHANGVSTRYGHLSKILVSVGDQVSAGATIGLVGSTGRSTGPHLHYETRRNGRAEDPTPFLAAGRAL